MVCWAANKPIDIDQKFYESTHCVLGWEIIGQKGLSGPKDARLSEASYALAGGVGANRMEGAKALRQKCA